MPPPSVESQPVIQTRQRPWLRSGLWLTAVALASVVGYLISNWIHAQDNLWNRARFAPFATSSALEVFPAWAPNSRSVAYAADVDGIFQIFMRSNGASTPAQLTRSTNDCFFPFWSPDGIRIYFISEQTLWSIGATGGTPEKILDNVAQATVANDGHTLAVLRGAQNAYAIWTGDITGKKLTKYAKGPFSKLRALPWSYLRFVPDGKSLRHGLR